jgi:hypothetical protein
MHPHRSADGIDALFTAPFITPPIGADNPEATGCPPNNTDQVMEALLNLISPKQYQQPSVASEHGAGRVTHADPSSNAFELGGTDMWGDTMFNAGHGIGQGMFASLFSSDGLQQSQSTMPPTGEEAGLNPAISWPSASGGFAYAIFLFFVDSIC